MLAEIITWVPLLLTAICSGISAYCGAYLKAAGKMRKLNESLDETTKQIRSHTQAAEEVRSKLSKEMWVEQQKWEFKRDLYLPILDILVELHEKCLKANKIMNVIGNLDDEDWDRYQSDRNSIMNDTKEYISREVEPLEEKLWTLTLKKGNLFLDDEITQHIENLRNAENIRSRESFKQYQNDVKNGRTSFDDINSYHSEEISISHKAEAVKKAYRLLLDSARRDLALNANPINPTDKKSETLRPSETHTESCPA
ncbi:hypothetical protein [Microbulbifer sp. SSSA005]|uniref:hypothetical protein n=1 Tax=unclassified Microbulbifer TaxID=2619833 RepID=UPI00403AE832